MSTGLLVGRVFIGVCIVITALCVVKAETVARWTFRFRQKDWHLKERSIPTLARICRVWNGVMFFVLLYLFWTLPNYF